jgi:hypothetical protein
MLGSTRNDERPEILATLESAKYYSENMIGADIFKSDMELLYDAVKSIQLQGVIAEFGVASGRTINYISSLTDQEVLGFDSFEGLPEDWRTGFKKGCFRQERLPAVNSNVKLMIGLFENTLKDYVKHLSKPISLLHIDCDIYSSTKTILSHLEPFIVPGTIIVFDEYFNYPGWHLHEFKAFREFSERRGLRYRYKSLVPSHQQVCVAVEHAPN